MRIALVRFSSLGDVILQSSVAKWLKSLAGEHEIIFVTTTPFKALVEEHPDIDQVITIDRKSGVADLKNLKELSQKLKNEYEVDLIFDLHNTLRSKILRLFSMSTPSLVVGKRSFKRFLLTRLKIDLLQKTSSHHHRIKEEFSFLVGEEQEARESYSNRKVTALPESFSKAVPEYQAPYIVISPVASFATKRWPMQHVRSLIKMMLAEDRFKNDKIIIIAGPDDTYCDEIFDDELSSNERLINLQGKTSLEQSAQIISQAKICVTNDTGSLHMAEALGVSVIALFGATSESFGFRPHLKSSMAISKDLPCRPCSNTGSKPCKHTELKCMLAITPEEVLAEGLRLLEEKNDSV